MKKIISIIIGVISLITTSCTQDCPHFVLEGNDAYITSISAKGDFGSVEANISSNDVTIILPFGTDPNSISVDIKISDGANIDRQSSEVTSWAEPQMFTVTSANGENTNQYSVTTTVSHDTKKFEGLIELGSQSELDEFGKAGYTIIEGITLYTSDNSDPITNVDALSNIIEVTGNLVVYNTSIINLEFPNLARAGRIAIQSLDLESMIMPKLEIVADELTIGMDVPVGQFPPAHEKFSTIELSSLEYVGNSFYLNLCSKLSTLESLSNLKFVGGDFVVLGGEFTSLQGLNNLTNVNNTFAISSTELKSLEGFMVEEIGYQLSLGLDYITDLSPLKSLKKIGTVLTLKNNRELKSLSGIENIDVPVIQIESFLKLESLDGLPVKSNMRFIQLSGLESLTDISALSKLETIEESFSLSSCPALKSLDGLDNLKSVGINLTFGLLDGITDLSGINNIEHIGASLSISKMLVLKKLPKFSKLTSVGDLYLENLIELENLDGLESITDITKGGLNVLACKKLTDVSGLRNVKTVNCYTQKDRIKFQFNEILKSYEPIGENLLQAYLTSNRLYIKNNGYNPTAKDIQDKKYTGEGGMGIGSDK